MIKIFHCNCRSKLLVYIFARLQKQLNIPKQDKIGMDLKRINAGKSLALHLSVIISENPIATKTKM